MFHIYLIIFSLFLTFITINILQKGLFKRLIDIPNKRSSHSKPTLTGGGIAFVIVFTLICIANKIYMPLILLPLSIVGFLDDMYGLSSTFRYCIQAITAFALVINSSTYINTFTELSLIKIVFFIFLIFVVTAIINFINFMDGLDMLIGNSFFIFIFLYSLFYKIFFIPLAFSLIIFLYFNRPPAKIFMGDVGSTFLGSIYCLIVLNTDSWITSFGLILVIAPLLMDAFFTRIMMFLKGFNFFSPHKLHLYQRLYQSGLSKIKINIIYCLPIFLNFILFKYSYFWVLISFVFIELIMGLYFEKKYANCIPNLKN